MIPNEYIEKYLSGQISDTEAEKLLQWIHESESNKKEFEDACKLWYNIHTQSFNSEKAFEDFTTYTQPKATILPLWKKIISVAAVALLAIGCFTMFNKHTVDSITIANTDATIKTVALPDGSTIYLQHGASITYPKTFDDNNRTVSSTGTLFCDIYHDETAPFTITNNDLKIKVLGTSFQINSTNNASVVVESGKVQVLAHQQSVIIEKGERVDVTDNTLVAHKNNDINYLSWKTGLLQFRNTNLSQVFSDLSRHYSCEFIYTKSCADVAKVNLTGSYQDLTLEQVLTMIETAIPEFHYELNNNQILVSNK